VLKAFAADLRADVDERLRKFLSDPDVSTGLIELREIANTKATLWLTEMFLSTLLKLAKDGVTTGKVLVVIEEAHTVMPEASFAGLGDFDSKGTVAKISQLALQGRKYSVGLLVLAQRTATVSKSVLTQCNTVISFTYIDDTSINFLRNVYGSAIAEGLPSLKKLRAVAHGQWVKSDLPVLFDVPFDQAKADRIR
jgi:DNA helicase HerA-like ATPase